MRRCSLTFGACAALICAGYGVLAGFVQGSFTNAFVLLQFGAAAVLALVWFVRGGRAAAARPAAAGSRLGQGGLPQLHLALDLVLALGLFAAVNWLANRHERRWDTTERGVYSLAPESVEVLREAARPIRLVVIDPQKSRARDDLLRLLELYRQQRRALVTYQLLDPRKDPRAVAALALKAGDVAAVEYGSGPDARVTRVSRAGEEQITNALLTLIRGRQRKLYYVVGHGEAPLDRKSDDGIGVFAAGLEDLRYTLEPLVLAERDIPEDAAALLLIAPKLPLSAEEQARLTRFIEHGGGLLLCAEPGAAPEVSALAAHFGLAIGRNVVLDRAQQLQGSSPMGWQIMARSYAYHPITKNVAEGEPTLFTIASTVTVDPARRRKGAEYTELVVDKSPTAWAESNLDALFAAEPQVTARPAEAQAGLPLAVAYDERYAAGGASTHGARLVVFGDSDWIRNAGLLLHGNREVALSSVNWAAGEGPAVTIAPRRMREGRYLVPGASFRLSIALSFLLPQLLLLAGLGVWWRRRAAAC